MLDATGMSGEAMELLAAEGILQLLPPLDLNASDGGPALPMDTFFKEKPDLFGADAVAVAERGEKDGPKTRHIIRVQVKVSSDMEKLETLSTGDVARILQKMNDSFRDDGSSNGVPVYVVPVVADHEVMLDMWPARVKQFASATGIRNYSKPRP
ncbi:hypothetical protein FNF28_06913 [Cafeteria roenbergensis]|uniref:Uncharacterized protein n=1 Tax=Cafeteria roenbergensis TaxID=33653 RepID=A0A5A8CNM0_CAFRO|nr:hypothetical protein FNF28_06913 [Cafeteria roenbergensis]